ncbi:hypothetical protein RRG08_022554 [Elysia crispata]|uniref:Uncharacterized protein n=1 Tax=Elysia crispata TaxID=231223 RepID=A0AAE0Z1V2_9GAST|nr:hypothetical protein RRG08_022554 [Elysia crispata]
MGVEVIAKTEDGRLRKLSIAVSSLMARHPLSPISRVADARYLFSRPWNEGRVGSVSRWRGSVSCEAPTTRFGCQELD